MATLTTLRKAYHRELARTLLGARVNRSGKPLYAKVRGNRTPVFTNADKDSDMSVDLAARMAKRMGIAADPRKGAGSTSGSAFERATLEFVEKSLGTLAHLRAGRLTTLAGPAISKFAQYSHLDDIEKIVKEYKELEVALGGDYVVTPDIVVVQDGFTDKELNAEGRAVTGDSGLHSLARADEQATPRATMHASVSCKWTMRSDRAQNIRTEALNLIRNRKGRVPHIAAVTMEPTASRLASIAHGTGDVDCVYHGALYELLDAAAEGAAEYAGAWTRADDAIQAMVAGRRLRDISDLPLDLIV